MARKLSLNHLLAGSFGWLERTGKLCRTVHHGFTQDLACNRRVLGDAQHIRQIAIVCTGHRCFQLRAQQNKAQQFRSLVTNVTSTNQTIATFLQASHWSPLNKGKQLGGNIGVRQASSAVGTKKKRRWPRYLATGLLVIVGSGTVFVAYKLYDFKRRGMKPLYIPKLPLQFFGPCGSYKGITIISALLSSIERVQDLEARNDDVFVISFPRSGTTWTQEIVYMVSNQADVSKASSRNMEDRFPYLEDQEANIDKLNAMESPRFIKTHLPYRLLPQSVHEKKPKIIYVMRNPKDMIVSCYHLWRKLKMGYKGTCMEFCELFLQDKMLFSPWLDHVKGYWERRDDENILFIKYEDLAKNLKQEVEKIARFLDKTLTPEQVATIVDHCSFESMKNNDKVNYMWWDDRGYTNNIGTGFIRKGKVGDWKNSFTPEMEKRVMAKIKKPLAEIGLKVSYGDSEDVE